MRATIALAYVLILAATTQAQQIPIGRGCTTATYIDKDCDGYGAGKKSSGLYPMGVNTWETMHGVGDLPDADDDDPTVNTADSWRQKWGSDNSAFQRFLQQRRGFTDSSRIWYLALDGDDATGVVNDPTRPFRTTRAASTAIHNDHQGGVIVLRGGIWANTVLHGSPYTMSGTGAHPLYYLAYPGERVEVNHTGDIVAGLPNSNYPNPLYWPWKGYGYVTLDGFIFANRTLFGLGDPVKMVDTDHVTLRNMEFAGWHQVWFGNHTEDSVIEDSVFHDMHTHAIYYGWAGYLNPYGAADFDFADNETKYQAGQVPGASYRATIRNNVLYNNGISGYEAVHINCYIKGVLIDGNIISYSSGAIGLQTGVYNAVLRNNVLFDNGRAAITLSLYSSDGAAAPATIRNVTIEHNTIWGGKASESIRVTNPTFAILANDYSATQGHWIRDVFVRNNIMVTSNSSVSGTNIPLSFMRNSYPNSWTVEHNAFWMGAFAPRTTDPIIAVSNTADPTGQGAGRFSLDAAQSAFPQFRGNVYADPKFWSASTDDTLTPWLFDFALRSDSPAIRLGIAAGVAIDIRGVEHSDPPSAGAYAHSNTLPATRPRAPSNVSIR